MTDRAEGQALSGHSPGTIWSHILQWVHDYPGGAALSERFKSAFRLALAMVITYGISLAMDWDKTFWAALSVIFCSLATAGESINHSVDRIVGTVAAAILALLLAAAFPQQRWLFLIGLSTIIAVCSYRMTGSTPRDYVWFNAGFNLPIIAIMGETSGSFAPATFDIAILRVQQTALGAIVYSLVAVLVWPRRGDEDFFATVRGICDTQCGLFSGYVQLVMGKGAIAELQKPLAGVAAQLPTLRSKFEGAAYDSPDVRMMSGTWVALLGNIRALHTAFDRWGSGFGELQGLDLRRYLPGCDRFIAEVEARFQCVDRLLSGRPALREPGVLELPLDEQALAELPHFQRAAVVSCRDRLLAVGGLAGSLFDNASRIHSGEPAFADESTQAAPRQPWTIDLDRLNATIRQTTALWLAFLAIIYIEGVPIVVATVALTNAFSMVMGKLPHLPATMMYKPVIQGGLLGGAFYMFIMLHLEGFWELGGFLFAAIFALAYLFHEPRAVLVRGIWMTMLVLIIGADNQQTYSFLVFANWLLVGVMFVTFMAIAWRFPISFRAEDRLRAQFRRYWLSTAFLLRDLAAEGRGDWRHRWRRNFHGHQLIALPPRLKVWATALSPSALEAADREHLDVLLLNVHLLGHRLRDLQESYPDAIRLASVGELRHRGEQLRLRLAEMMEQLAQDPASFDSARCLHELERAENALQHLVEDLLGAAELTREDGQHIYRLLAAYHGLLGAFRGVADELDEIDWQRLCESRF